MAGGAGGGRHFGHPREQGVAVEAGERHVQGVGQAVRRIAVEVDTRHLGAQPVEEAIAQAGHLGAVGLEATRDELAGRAEPDDQGRAVGAGAQAVLVARAVAPLAKLLRWFAPHREAFERMLVIKGPAWTQEREEAHSAGLLKRWELRKLASYPLAGTPSESVVLSLRAKGH